jgi:hypothetical protein
LILNSFLGFVFELLFVRLILVLLSLIGPHMGSRFLSCTFLCLILFLVFTIGVSNKFTSGEIQNDGKDIFEGLLFLFKILRK